MEEVNFQSCAAESYSCFQSRSQNPETCWGPLRPISSTFCGTVYFLAQSDMKEMGTPRHPHQQESWEKPLRQELGWPPWWCRIHCPSTTRRKGCLCYLHGHSDGDKEWENNKNSVYRKDSFRSLPLGYGAFDWQYLCASPGSLVKYRGDQNVLFSALFTFWISPDNLPSTLWASSQFPRSFRVTCTSYVWMYLCFKVINYVLINCIFSLYMNLYFNKQ